MSALAAPATVRSVRSRARNQALRATSMLALATLAAFCVSVSVGDFPIPLVDVPAAVLGVGDEGTVFVARELRLPRALAAVLVGIAFGVAGAVFQAVARNPLASPDILGVTHGASAAVVFTIVVAGTGFVLMAGAAFAGALATAAAIYLLAFREGLSPYRFVLVGIGVGAVATALTSYLLTEASLFEAAAALVWMTGSLNAVGWESVGPLALVLVVLLPAAALLAGRLRALQLGDDTARALGVRIERARLALLLVAVALVGVGTATAGPIAFVAFLAGPIGRVLARAPLALVPSALAGALIVLAGDVAGRRLFAPTEIPAGIFTGLCGAPYFLWLLMRANRSGVAG